MCALFANRRRGEKRTRSRAGGVQALFEGQFVRAEKTRSGANPKEPGLASLLRRVRRRGCGFSGDQWLERAKEGTASGSCALMTSAELPAGGRRFVEARAVPARAERGRLGMSRGCCYRCARSRACKLGGEVLRVANC